MRSKGHSRGFSIRHGVMLGFMALGALLLLMRLLYMQLYQQDFLEHQGVLRTYRQVPLMAFRGMIADRNGDPLAVSTPVDSIWVDPKQIDWTVPGWDRLFRLLALPRAETIAKIKAHSSRDFYYLKRQVEPSLATRIEALRVPGVYRQREYRRYYPSGEVAAQLIGFTNIDDQGQDGLELAFNRWLKGESGYKQVIRDRYGAQIESLARAKDARDGQTITLSIDKRLQYLAYRELVAAIERNQAKAGSVILLDPKTGEILALANYPSYNPNQRQRKVDASLRNRAMTDTFEPGSVMKPFSAANLILNGGYTPDTPVDTTPGRFFVAGKLVRDVHNFGLLDLRGVLRKSSNVGITKLTLTLKPELLMQCLQAFGFGQMTDSGFPGETSGRLMPPLVWRPFEVATLSFGYGLSVTAMQLAQAYAVLADGGKKHSMTFLKQEDPKSLPYEQVIPKEVADQVADMLHSVSAPGGSARLARIVGYEIAGKTGTVKKLSASGYTTDQYLSLFAGFAPVEDPKIVGVIMIDDPTGGQYYGGAVAAPVFGRVVGGALRILNVPVSDVDAVS